MKHAFIMALVFCASVGLSRAERSALDAYLGLTQAELSAKVGFPLRVYTLPAKARGGPAVLFWVYYQRSRAGQIEEVEFGFQYSPLKVCYMSPGIDAARFLSLERPADEKYIWRYNAQHGR
jgi:hypothetical protein